MPSADIWTETVPVRSTDLTPHGTASVPALCTYLQEVAGRHADALGVSMQRLQEERKAWILAQLHLDIHRPPKWQDEIVVETWPSGLDGPYATREFVLRTGETRFGVATSAWVVFDIDSRRPLRPPARLHAIEPPDRPPALAHDWNNLPLPERTDCERRFEVRYHDLDVNRHANNLRVLEWALETLPAEHLDTHQCSAVALQFKGEATLGEPVQATAQMDEDETEIRVRHALHHADDERTLAVATTEWAPRRDV